MRLAFLNRSTCNAKEQKATATLGTVDTVVPRPWFSLMAQVKGTIRYSFTDINDIELIRSLWTKLNEHHHSRAKAFKDHYAHFTFDARKSYFVKMASCGLLRIDLAFDTTTERYIGYCVSSVDAAEKEGEVESLFVEQEYRAMGIGSTFVKNALSWFEENGCLRIRVSVADGNEEAFPFYQKFGFFPRLTILELRKS